jgi:hypothetical protein
MNEEINWTNVTELRNVGQLLCKIKYKWENQATAIAQGVGGKNEELL